MEETNSLHDRKHTIKLGWLLSTAWAACERIACLHVLVYMGSAFLELVIYIIYCYLRSDCIIPLLSILPSLKSSLKSLPVTGFEGEDLVYLVDEI